MKKYYIWLAIVGQALLCTEVLHIEAPDLKTAVNLVEVPEGYVIHSVERNWEADECNFEF